MAARDGPSGPCPEADPQFKPSAATGADRGHRRGTRLSAAAFVLTSVAPAGRLPDEKRGHSALAQCWGMSLDRARRCTAPSPAGGAVVSLSSPPPAASRAGRREHACRVAPAGRSPLPLTVKEIFSDPSGYPPGASHTCQAPRTTGGPGRQAGGAAAVRQVLGSGDSVDADDGGSVGRTVAGSPECRVAAGGMLAHTRWGWYQRETELKCQPDRERHPIPDQAAGPLPQRHPAACWDVLGVVRDLRIAAGGVGPRGPTLQRLAPLPRAHAHRERRDHLDQRHLSADTSQLHRAAKRRGFADPLREQPGWVGLRS